MYARLLTFRGADDVDAGIVYLQEDLLPVLRAQHGYRGVSASVDRAGATFVILSLWETPEDRNASDGALGKARQEAHTLVGGGLSLEAYEQVGEAITKPPAPGCWLNLVRVRMDPATIDGNLIYFNTEILPQLAALPGFRALRNLIDRLTGRGVVRSVWDDRACLDAALVGLPRRLAAAEARGIVIGEVAQRQIVVAENA